MLRLISCLLYLPTLALSAVLEVLPGESIQHAVNTAMVGDTILVHDGDYTETTVLYGKMLTIASAFLLDGDSAHAASTIISPDSLRPDSGSCFVYAYGEAQGSRLVGLTLENGRGTWWSSAAGGPLGGAVHVRESAVSIEHCRVRNSNAHVGGGVGVAGTAHLTNASVSLRNCIFETNSVDAWGGGVYASWSALTLRNCLFEGDSSNAEGGGLIQLNTTADVDSCVFRHCVAYSGGGVNHGGDGTINHCLFEENRAYATGGICDLLTSGNLPIITGCLFRNTAGTSIAIDQQSILQGGMRFVGNMVENQVTSLVTGSLLAVGGQPDIGYNVFRNNDNIAGGAVYTFSNFSGRIHHNVFAGNSTHDPVQGSAVTCMYRSFPVIDSNLFIGNNSPTISREVWPNYHPIIDARNNWWGDASGPYHETQNPTGMGDTLILDSILFVPWLTSPPDTAMPNDVREGRRPAIASTWEFFGLYPNPFNSEIRILIAGFAGRDFRLTLHNLLGQQVAMIHAGSLTGGEIYFHAPPSLASGVYFVRAAQGNMVRTKKAIFLK